MNTVLASAFCQPLVCTMRTVPVETNGTHVSARGFGANVCSGSKNGMKAHLKRVANCCLFRRNLLEPIVRLCNGSEQGPTSSLKAHSV